MAHIPENGFEIDFDDDENLSVEELAEAQLSFTDQTARVETDEEITKDNEGRYQSFRGEKFRLSKSVSFMTLTEWAASAEYGAGSTAGMVALYHILQDILDGPEFDRFRAYVRETKKDTTEEDASDLVDFCSAAVEVMTARPTVQPGTSRSGSPKTSPASTGRSSGKRGQARKR